MSTAALNAVLLAMAGLLLSWTAWLAFRNEACDAAKDQHLKWLPFIIVVMSLDVRTWTAFIFAAVATAWFGALAIYFYRISKPNNEAGH